MALVRRAAVVGSPAPGPAAVAPGYNGGSPAVGYAPVHGRTTAGRPGGDDHPPTGIIPVYSEPAGQTAAAAPGNGEAAAAPSPPASGLAILFAFALMGIGLYAAYELNYWRPVGVLRVGNQMSAFGALFAFAAAVERLLEPLSQWLPGRHSKADYERMVAAVANRHPVMGLSDVAAAKTRVDRARANRTMIVWGIATAVATVASASGGFYLLHMLADDPNWNGVSNWVDALITGLVVGSGTKPLHDIISRVQKGKERAEES
jgi:hypothetical protein